MGANRSIFRFLPISCEWTQAKLIDFGAQVPFCRFGAPPEFLRGWPKASLIRTGLSVNPRSRGKIFGLNADFY